MMEPKINNPLHLISLYNSGSEDSEEEIISNELPRKKRKCENLDSEKNVKRLPLPSIIGNLYNNAEDHKDNPEEHEGRIRSFPHERGAWSTYIYFPITVNTMIENIIKSFVKINDQLKIIEEPHLSLTRTVVLRHHWIDPFIETVQTKLRGCSSFSITFNSIEIYTNDDKTRSFIGITVGVGEKELIKLVNVLDNCLAEFKLPEFYKEPSFHISILSTVGEIINKEKLICKFNKVLQESFNSDPEEWTFNINHLKCKTGNKMFKFNLK